VLRSGCLRGLGVLLFLERDAVRFRAPHGVLTPALRRAISQRGRELAALLRRGLLPAEPSFWGVYKSPGVNVTLAGPPMGGLAWGPARHFAV
jgi:hypothetical protein